MSSKRALWTDRIEAWRGSGESVAAFCRARGLGYAQFGYWQRVLRASVADHGSSPLIPVVVEAATPGDVSVAIELALPSGVRVRVPRGFGADEAVALVRGLLAC